MAQDDASRSPAHPLIESDHIEGTAVYDADGKRIGTIKRLVIEKVSGHVAYAVTTLGGLLGLGAEVHSIPWEQLHYDMCGRPLRSKRNLQERCGPWSGADMCAAFDAARTPQARMGVRRSGPIQAHALAALVAKLVFLIRSLDRCAIPLL